MRLILIRHGDPDYVHDSLTEKGKREAALLGKRAEGWQVDDVYTSPFGRAVETAQPCLKVWKKGAKVLDWAQEFFLPAAEADWQPIPWDFYPADWTMTDANFRENDWVREAAMAPARANYEWVVKSLDEFLKGYGYEREGRYYRAVRPNKKTVVIFCHFGISMMLLSRLLNISAQTLLHGMFLPPTSITVLNTEERRANEAYFRVERLGDCAHLIAGGEPISASGYFTDIMQEGAETDPDERERTRRNYGS